jgi:iron complex outermembrane receptor protein
MTLPGSRGHTALGVCRLLTFLFVYAILPSGHAGAQGPAPQPPAEQPTEGEPVRLKENVEVTATRGSVEKEMSPASSTLVLRPEIERRNVSLVDQALTAVEGVYGYRQRGVTDNEVGIGMRGFSGRGSGQARVLVLLDGQPLNNSYTGAVNWTGLSLTDVDRIEVVRGPFSALYGGNAMGGVVNILTRPIDRRSAELTVRYGTFETQSYSGRVGARVLNRLGFGLSFESLDTGGYPTQEVLRTATDSTSTGGVPVTGVVRYLTRTGGVNYGVGLRGDNSYDRYGLRARGEYTVGQRAFASFQFIRQANESGWDAYSTWIRSADGQLLDSGNVIFQDEDTWKRITLAPTNYLGVTSRSSSNLYQGQFLASTGRRGDWRLQVGVLDAPDDYSGTPGAAATLTERPGTFSTQRNRGAYASAQWSSTLATRHTITTGVDARGDRGRIESFPTLDYVEGGSSGPRDTFAAGRARTWAVFAQDLVALTDRISVTAGGRFDSWRTRDGESQKSATLPVDAYASRSSGAPTGKVALVYRAADPTVLRVSVGSAFRSPSVFDLYRDTRLSSGSLLLGNAALEPERMTSWELGVRQKLGPRVDVDATYYDNRIRDLIYRSLDLAADPTGLTSRNFNAGRARTRGTEMAVTIRPRAWLTLRPIYTFSDALITRNEPAPATVGKQIPFVPRHVAAGTVTATYSGLAVTGTTRYQTAVFATDTNTDTTKGVPGSYDEFVEVDLAASLALHRHLTLTVSGENLFDRQYYLFYRNPGRVLSAGVRIHF